MREMKGRLMIVKVLIELLLEVELRLSINQMLVGAHESAVKAPYTKSQKLEI